MVPEFEERWDLVRSPSRARTSLALVLAPETFRRTGLEVEPRSPPEMGFGA